MRNRSIFWPLVMIAAGVLWIMIGIGTIPRANLWALTHTLPYLLILLGIGLILRAYWRFAGMLVSVLVVAGAIAAVLYAPRFDWDIPPSWGWNVFNVGPELGGAVAGSGTIKSESREVGEFQAINIDYPAEIIVRQGDTESVSVEADDNLLPQLATEVRNGTLYFENSERNWRARVNPTKTVMLSITVVDLNEVHFTSAGKMQVEGLQTDSLSLSVSGAGDVTLTGLNANSFETNLSGAGNITADGESGNLQVRISGLGNFKGDKLKSQNASVQISGAGSATTWAEQTLDANISGAGSIEYYGDPQISEQISGVGNVSKIGNK